MANAIETRELRKVYGGKVEALKGVSLSVRMGELFTLLGPNGAGKTTFLRIVATQLLPTSGEAYLLGYDVVREANEVRKHIAVVPQDAQPYSLFTPWDYAYYFARLRGYSRDRAKKAAEEALKAVDLWNLRKRTCSSLSGGERKRAIIASALSSGAEVLLLDEPTSGLDAVARRRVWRVLRDIVKEGRTILLTTHIMEEAEMVSDRLAVINRGKLVAMGTVADVKGLVEERFRVVVEGEAEFPNEYPNATRLGGKSVFYFKSQAEALEFVKRALATGLRAEAAPVTLEDVFVKLVGEW